MAITFPSGEDRYDGAVFYVPNSDLVLKYDESQNSWNIIGPDNLATIDYVDQAVATDTTKTYRNSSLHRETNVIGVSVRSNCSINQNCNDFATTSFSGDHIYDADEVPLSPDNYNPPEYLISTKGTLPEWHECNDTSLARGNFSFVGHDLVTSNGSAEYRYILGISISRLNADMSVRDIGDVVPGDVLELYFDSTSRSTTAEIKFALYEVMEVYEGNNVVSYSVLFRDSNTPTEQIIAGLEYYIYTYTGTLEKTGGVIEGDLKVVSDSLTAFEVYKNEESISGNNPYNLVFNVNTTNNSIVVNEEYNNSLKIPATDTKLALDPQGIATIGYVNDRLGLREDERGRKEDGPYLRLEGGSIDKLEILNDASGGLQNFIIRGIINDTSTANDIILSTINNTSNDQKSEINYYGQSKSNNNLVTKKYVDDKVANNSYDLSPFLKMDASRNITKKYLSYDSKLTVFDDITSYDDYDVVPAKAIKKINVATVHKGATGVPGVLFEDSGVLYYNKY